MISEIKKSLHNYDLQNKTNLLDGLIDIKISNSGIILFINPQVLNFDSVESIEEEITNDFVADLYKNTVLFFLQNKFSILENELHIVFIAQLVQKIEYNSKNISLNTTSENIESKDLEENNKSSHQEKSKLKTSFKKNYKNDIPGVEKTIVIFSGKGGVGKSTLTALLAYSFESIGKRIAILDADIHGPSMGRMIGIKEEPLIKDNVFIPPTRGFIKIMSSSFFSSDQPLIWRGPMISNMLHHMLYNTEWRWSNLFNWKNSEYMIIDTPPGTGDLHLSLINNYKIDATILISTNQEVAIDAMHKSMQMLRKLDVKIIGIVENLFSSNKEKLTNDLSNVEKYAKEYNIQYLGKIPFIDFIWHNLDQGLSPLKTNKLMYFRNSIYKEELKILSESILHIIKNIMREI
ncbi:P-loop NTPase [Lyticum sinuosum]|uniref:Iron-sulfur cluster carrier protein n=1 Tax=Lyticum sinuosum TaxID=1332059 RepID=A0AAE5AGX9_9RICK|nr:P-loop NTPase [Lyticum sinuosum]MDZ5761327.1 Mrp/NBP35 ATP-binding family protein [Lyticum sinuosum]